MKLRTVFIALLIGAVSCSDPKEEPPITIPGQEYFPLQTNRFITYAVDSTRIIQNAGSNYKFQLRVSVTGSFLNAEGNVTYRLQREKRRDATQPWKAAGTWSAYKTDQRAVVTEGTICYIKLAFPASVGTGWNGNALNNLGGEDLCNNNSKCDHYVVTDISNDVLEVTQEDRDDPIMLDLRIERYSKNVGLTYKHSTTLEYCTGDPCSGVAGYVVDGLKYTQQMIDSGTL
ncbi:MAG TPA: hypothetical protein VF473_01330 [Cyclobacteriaceae bacterium]